MTGFGRAEEDASIGKFIVEIQSVNRKYLEIFVTIPKELSRFEYEVRKQISESISRGGISVRIFLLPIANALELLPDIEMLKRLKVGWEKIAFEIGVSAQEINLPFLMQYLPSQTKQDFVSEEHQSVLKLCLKKALDTFCLMKQTEGKALAQDLLNRLKELEDLLKKIEELAPEATVKMRQKLFEKMEETFKLGPELEERLLREIALFAEKVDISEEITRFKSHIGQFKAILKGGVVGRKMDFLIQELGREVNTIGSKSIEARISHLVVEMKSELEKIREQVQNIE